MFIWLVNSLGAVALFGYVLIALARLRMGAEGPGPAHAEVWGYPWLPYLAIAGMVGVILAMALLDDVPRAAVVEPRVARRRVRSRLVALPARGRARVVSARRRRVASRA